MTEGEVFVSEEAGRVGLGPDEAQDGQTAAEGGRTAAEGGRTAAVDECAVPDLMKDYLIGGPLGMLTLYLTWSPLLKIGDHWSEGRYEYAIPLTIFAIILATAVAATAVVVFRELRNRFEWWRPRSGRRYSYEMVTISDMV